MSKPPAPATTRTLGLRASYGKAIPGLYDPDYVGANKAATNVGLTLSVPIFSGLATQSGVRSALAQRDATQDAVEQTRRAIERSTRDAYQTLVAGISEVEARRLALFSARSACEASQVGLEVGTRTVLDVLDNQRTLFTAQRVCAGEVQLPAEPPVAGTGRRHPGRLRRRGREPPAHHRQGGGCRHRDALTGD